MHLEIETKHTFFLGGLVEPNGSGLPNHFLLSQIMLMV